MAEIDSHDVSQVEAFQENDQLGYCPLPVAMITSVWHPALPGSLTWVSKTRLFLASPPPGAPTDSPSVGSLSPSKFKLILPLSILSNLAAPPSAHPIDPLLSPPTPPPPNSAARFLAGKFLRSSPFLKTWSHLYAKGLISLPDTGFMALIAARTGNFLTAHRLARLGRLHERFRATCPCCGLEVEHLQHILFVCPCWSSQRTLMTLAVVDVGAW